MTTAPSQLPPFKLAARAKYLGFLLAAALVVRLPERLAYGLALPAGMIAWALTPGKRAGVRDNLAHVLPEAAPHVLNHLSRSVYQSVASYYVDLFRSPRVKVERLRQERLEEEGLANLLEAIAEGRGVILATVHLGAPELAIQAARAWGLFFFVLMEPVQPPELSDLYLRLRASRGHRFMPVGLSAVKEALRTLRGGGVVLLVVDRDIQHNGVIVPFFGAPAPMPSGAVELSRVTGAPIIVTVSHRLPNGRSRVVLEPRLDQAQTADRAADLRTNVARLLARFEPHIRQDPDQWLVLESIWNKQTAGPRQ